MGISLPVLGVPGLLGGEGFDWYVDSINGDNANSGKTPAQAFKTFTGLAAAWAAGDSVGIARGSVYLQQLDIPGDGCSVGVYGSGAQPRIDCRTPLANASWSKTVGQTNVYEYSVTFATAGVSDPFVKIWEDDVSLPIAASVAACDSTPGSYYIASHTISPQTIYVHASDSSDVTVNGKSYKYNPREFAIDGTGYDNLTIDNIHGRGNLHGGGAIKTGDNATVTNCLLQDGGKHNLLVGAGSIVSDCTFQDAYFGGTASTMFVYNATTFAGETVTIRDCTFTHTNTSDVVVSALNGHHNTSGNLANVDINTCTFTGFTQPLSGINHALIINMDACTFTNCKTNYIRGENVDTGDDIVFNVRDCVWNSNVGSQNALFFDQGHVYNIVRYTCTPTALAASGYWRASAAATITISDSTIDTGATTGNRAAFYNSNAGATWSITGCTFAGGWTTIYSFATAPTWSADFNSFNAPYASGLISTIGANTYANLAAHQAGTAQDLNSVEV